MEKPSSSNVLKFAILSALGAFLFIFPIPTEDAFNIPLGLGIDWIGNALASVGGDDFSLASTIVLIITTLSIIGSAVAFIAKPKFITENETLKGVFMSSPLFMASKVIALILVWFIYFDMFSDNEVIGWFTSPWTGGVMMDIANTLIAVFLILGFTMPLITDFGLMEFIGVLIKKFIRALFTLPGRSAVNLLASWFGSSTAAIILTKTQHEKGFYTGREAAVICVNFSMVSVPFSFVISSVLDINHLFLMWYLVICITCLILAIILPRVWPLRGLEDTYVGGAPQWDEDAPKPEGVSGFSWAVKSASDRAGKATAGEFIKTGLNTYVNIFLDLIPLVLAWGILALVVFEETQIFQFLSMPFGWFMELLRIPGAMEYAPATIVGFLDMYLPAIVLGADATFEARFILGALSIVQIIYMTETGILIWKSKMPLGFFKILAIFLIRTIVALPIITLLTRLLVM